MHLLAQYTYNTCQILNHTSGVPRPGLMACAGNGVQDEDCMRRMVWSVLDVAAQARVTSVALPLLGAGIAGWPIAVAAKAHIEEVLEMAEQDLAGSSLKVGLYFSCSIYLSCCHCSCTAEFAERCSSFQSMSSHYCNTGSLLRVSFPLDPHRTLGALHASLLWLSLYHSQLNSHSRQVLELVARCLCPTLSDATGSQLTNWSGACTGSGIC